MEYSHIKGVGLLEIMIAMLLSVIVLAEIFRYSYFLENSVSLSSAKVESIEKNNVLFAWLVRDIEMAGYVGCVHAHSRKNIVDDQGYLLDQWLTVSGGELISQYMSAHQVLVIDKTSNNEVLIKNSDGLKADDVVFLENCWGAELAKIKKISSVNYGAQKKIQFYYPIKASETKNFYLAKLVLHKFYVKKTSRKNAKGDYIFSLYVTNEKNDSDEILENIQSMNIKKSHNNFVISIAESKNSSPILLAAKGYNAN
jgi:hypothetical protein